jgi:predicted porin
LKKAIAAAAMAALAGMASAEVAVYGVLDQAVRVTDGASSQVSGSFHTSRLGFRGTEDLGGGNSVSFKLEGRLDVSNGDMTGDEFFNRESSVSLNTGFGSFAIGRMDTSGSQAIDDVAGFANFGNFTNASGVEYAGDRANTVRYTTPRISGFEFQIGQSEATNTAEKLDSASVTFASDSIDFGVGYDRTASDDIYTAVAAAVKFSGASVGAMYGIREAATETKVTVLSARVPVGQFGLHAAYNITDTGSKTETATVGASYDFSRRTTLLAVYQDREEADADFFQIGLKHSF